MPQRPSSSASSTEFTLPSGAQVELRADRYRSLLWDSLPPRTKARIADLEARKHEIVVEYNGQRCTFATALELESDQLLYGTSFASVGAGGLLERISPLGARIEP